MSFTIKESFIPGCFEIEYNRLTDKRGYFTKTFNVELFKEAKIKMEIAEEYFTFSCKHVFRGLHFQLPPMDLDKIVYCVDGKVNDYVIDLRLGSPSYGKHASFELNGDNPKAIFIPSGLAHGFHVISDSALMQYKVSTIFDKDCDTGISYLSFPFSKEICDPIISERDQKFVTLENFNSPFIFKG
jgi:dTDP-4-dehydrorhamnose 3,5-epimerase